MRFRTSNRVRKNSDFAFVKDNAQKADCSAFVIYVKEVEDSSRLGLIVGRRVGNAVTRNYAKRIFREIFRLALPDFKRKLAVIVYVRRGFDFFEFKKLKQKFDESISKMQ